MQRANSQVAVPSSTGLGRREQGLHEAGERVADHEALGPGQRGEDAGGAGERTRPRAAYRMPVHVEPEPIDHLGDPVQLPEAVRVPRVQHRDRHVVRLPVDVGPLRHVEQLGRALDEREGASFHRGTVAAPVRRSFFRIGSSLS
jgi:hypothetical protein